MCEITSVLVFPSWEHLPAQGALSVQGQTATFLGRTLSSRPRVLYLRPLSFLFLSVALPAALKYTLITASYL